MSNEKLVERLDVLEREVIDLKVDCNIKDERIRQLEKDLASARRQIREYEVGTQTMRKLQILGNSDDDTGYDPYGSANDRPKPWEKAR